MASKIEQSLTHEQLQEFLKRCYDTPGLDLQAVKDLASEYGIQISLMAASRFKNKAYESYVAELKAKREMAEAVAAIAKDGTGMTEAACGILTQKIFDQAIGLDAGAGSKELNTLSLAVSRLRAGDQRAQLLESVLEERAREKQEWEEKRQALLKTRDKLEQATPATADEIRAAAVEEIDRIMGLKK